MALNDMSDDLRKVITCPKHGIGGVETFVCRHLHEGSGQGWFHADDGSGDPYPDAWCAACDKVLLEEGEWTQRAEAQADIVMVCAKCYEEICSGRAE